MKRIAIFAHYDKQSIIDDYVVIYLEHLKKNADKIIFVSDCFLKEKELKKINHLVLETICEPHGEYDFGSYKRGFTLLKTKYQKELSEADELIFANDSCYCLRDLSKIFEDTKNQDCDAWSLGDDYENPHRYDFYILKKYYLQSYFIVFRRTVFLEDFFHNFLAGIRKLSNKSQIIFEYEEGLSRLLNKNNKKLYAYFAAKRVAHHIIENYIDQFGELVDLVKNNSRYNRDQSVSIIGNSFDVSALNYVHSNKFYFLLELGFPLLKRAIICKEITTFDQEKLTFFWQPIVRKFTSFDTNIITKHLKRISREWKLPNDLLVETYPVLAGGRNNLLGKIISRKTLWQTKHTKNNRLIIKFLKIPVLYRALPEEAATKIETKAKNLSKAAKLNGANNKKSPYRLAIFAHYDKNGFIENYVIDYLKSLREVANHIIFVSDCKLSSEELSKLDGLAEKIICEKHGEYDFGSYKRGFFFAARAQKNKAEKINIDDLKNYDQLIMANDSCYLLNSLVPAFKEMTERKSSDFWGMTQNSEQFLPHIQSYFLVFNQNVFLHKEFSTFFLKVKKESKKLAIVEKYEVGLTQHLLGLGFKKDSLVKEIFSKNPTLSEETFYKAVPKNFPLIKVPLLNRILWRKEHEKSI